MANGNQGFDFNQFLNTLMSASQANERLNIQKESLALQEASTTSQSNYRDYLIEKDKAEGRREDFELQSDALSQYPGLQKDWLKSQPFIKKNPEYGARIDEAFKARTELDDRITAAGAMPSGPRLKELRTIRLNTNLNSVQRSYLDTAIKGATEEATVTGADLAAQPAYAYYLEAKDYYKTISKAGRATDPKNPTDFIETEDEFQKRREAALDMMFSYEGQAREQEKAGHGEFPGLSTPFNEQFPYEQFPDEIMYDNIEDPLLEKEVDETLSDLGGPGIESDILPPELTPSTYTPTAENRIDSLINRVTTSAPLKRTPEETIIKEEPIKPTKITSLKEAFAAGTPPKEEMALTGNVGHRVNEIYTNYKKIEKIQNVISNSRSRRKESGLKGVGKNEEYNQKQIDKLKNKLKTLLSGVYDPSKKGLSDKFMEQYKEYGFVVPADKRESMMKYLSELF